jgi:hypothetical protein
VIVIVGHGPSIYSGLGSVIDSHTVVRLKRGLLETHDRAHWGSRTDYLCARSPRFDWGRFPFWLLKDSYGLYQHPNPAIKPTTGLCAVLECVERFPQTDIAVIGFDRLLHPEREGPSWPAHDAYAEHECLMKLGVKPLG